MIYFYVDTPTNMKKGVDANRFDESRLYRSLVLAEADGRGKVFVLDSRHVPATLSGSVGEIPRHALLNMQPYRKPVEVMAGGGIITKPGKKRPKILLIYRKGLWDLPKGKLDPGETLKKCARREVREELGISKVKVLEFLDTTTHGYRDGRKYVVKTSYWWHMSTEETEFIPQAAEKITDVRWFGLNKAKKVLGHETLIWLLNRVEHILV